MSKPSADRSSASRSSAKRSSASRSVGSRAATDRIGNRTVETPTKRPRSVSAPELTNRQRSILRGIGHHLHAIVQVGKDGITEGLLAAIANALEQHELIKIKLLETVSGDRHELSAELAKESRAALVQVIGRNLLLYRPRPETDPRPSLDLEL